MSSKTIPQISSSSEKLNLTLKGAHTSPAVPAGFILAQATPAELDYYGFPQANPGVKGRFSSPVQALIERKWTPKNRIIPDLEVRRGITHVLRPKGTRAKQITLLLKPPLIGRVASFFLPTPRLFPNLVVRLMATPPLSTSNNTSITSARTATYMSFTTLTRGSLTTSPPSLGRRLQAAQARLMATAPHSMSSNMSISLGPINMCMNSYTIIHGR